jgi:hypothetical protein
MAAVSIEIIAESEDIAALVGLGGEISSAVDSWVALSRELDVKLDNVQIRYTNVERAAE